MLFYQKHTYSEYMFGQQTVWFAVADNYSEIFQATGTETDIFLLETFKQDLDLGEAKFAVDELSFSINQATCQKDTDKNALAFTLECKDKFRVCAVFFLKPNETPNSTNMLFIGQLDNKVSGDDLMWNSVNFGTLINPIREYKFSALSLDIALLDKCSLTAKCYNENSVKIPNIYDRIRANNDADIIALKENNMFSYVASGGSFGADVNYYITLAKLSKVIELYLAKASAMMLDMFGINIEFILEESDFGLQVSPIQYGLSGNQQTIAEQYVYNNAFYNIGLNMVNSGANSMNRDLYIDLRMVHANYMRDLGDWNDRDDGYGSLTERGMNARAMYNTEKQYSFQSLGSVSDILFETARAFGCYLTSYYTLDTDGKLVIRIKYTPKLALTDSSLTYIIGASDASFNTAVATSDNPNVYYSQANNIASDGACLTKIEVNSGGAKWFTSDKLKADTESRAIAKDKEKTEFKRLVLSTSQTIVDGGNGVRTPLNTFAVSTPNKDKILITTALYINTHILEIEQRNLIDHYDLQFDNYTRPIGKIYAKIDGTPVSDTDGDGVQLSDYVNRTLVHEKTFYQTEYELTIPYWNGFSRNPSGTDCEWGNLRLGSIISLNEDIRVFTNGEWRIFRPTAGNKFVVVGNERSLSSPETKLKLQNTDRFAYNSYYEGKEGELLAPSKSVLWAVATDATEDLSNYKYCLIADEETILVGDAIMIASDGTAKKGIANKIYRGTTIGVVKLIRGNIAYYQDGGVIECQDYNLTVGGNVFVRTAPTTADSNISQLYVGADASNGDDLMIRLGKAITEKSFIYQIRELGLG